MSLFRTNERSQRRSISTIQQLHDKVEQSVTQCTAGHQLHVAECHTTYACVDDGHGRGPITQAGASCADARAKRRHAKHSMEDEPGDPSALACLLQRRVDVIRRRRICRRHDAPEPCERCIVEKRVPHRRALADDGRARLPKHLVHRALADVIARRSDEDLKCPWLDVPVGRLRVVEGECTGSELEAQLLRRSRMQLDLCKGAELAVGPMDTGLHVTHVELHHLRRCALPDVPDGEGHE
mmetsp:Transcript_94/g.206  ORF Transcript_94/g.206 Transcript_94/m.206 type:complete len:239 (-) Transcript_94:784-1500(-)